MTSRTLKLLTASTAFVAAASAGNAAVMTVTSSSIAPIQASDITGLNVSGTALISTTAGPAIQISGTAASPAPMPISISSGVIIRSTSVTGTISVLGDSNVTGVTVNNSGSIINVGGSTAIDTSALQADGTAIGLTVRNTGTISGTVTSGAGALTYEGTGGTQKGNITSSNAAGTDAVTLTGGTTTGNISLGNGINNVTISNSTLTGGYTGGSGVDTTVLTNATVTGALDASTGASDVLTIDGQNTFTNAGGISGYETVNINTDTILNNGLSGADTITLQAAKTLTVNNNFATASAGTFVNNGTLNIAGGKTVTADTYTANAGSNLGIGISDSTHVAQLIVANGIASGVTATINVGANAGYIASGTTYTIVDTTGSANANVVLSSNSAGVNRYSTALVGNDVVLTVGRVSTSSVVDGGDNQAVANALEKASASTNAQLVAVQSAITQQSSAAGVQTVVESLTPSIDGAGLASVNVTVDTGNQISNRLASLRGTGVATGDAMASKHMWMQGFGSTVEQDDRDGNSGYDASAGGVSLGVDTDTLIDGTTTGLAFSYGHGKVDSNGAGNATTDIDTYVGTLYGSRVLDGGIFVNGQVGLGYNQYDMERTVIGVGQSKGDTNGWQGTVKAETGKDFDAAGFTLTPLASLQYTYLDMDSYTETGAGGASLRVNPESLSTVDAGVGGNVAYAIPLTDGGTLKPSAHAKYIYRMGDTDMGTTSSFAGGGSSFNTSGVKADRSSVNLGAGLLLTTVAGTDLSVNYDADIRSNLTGHTGQVKARWAF